MRLVIDMQGAQTASRDRGIGRYTAAEPRRKLPWLIASVRLSITRIKGTTPEVLPLMPTFSPIERKLPQ